MTALRISALVHLDPKDLAYTAANVTIWSNLEPCLGIITACLPMMQPTAKKLWAILANEAKKPMLRKKKSEGSSIRPIIVHPFYQSRSEDPLRESYALTDPRSRENRVLCSRFSAG